MRRRGKGGGKVHCKFGDGGSGMSASAGGSPLSPGAGRWVWERVREGGGREGMRGKREGEGGGGGCGSCMSRMHKL